MEAISDEFGCADPDRTPQLSHKHRAFIAGYLRHFNGTKAALEAGYSEGGARRSATRLLKEPAILAEIEAELGARGMSAAEALDGLAAISRADMADFAKELGWPQLAEAREAGRLDSRAIRDFELEETVHELPDGSRKIDRKVRLKLHSGLQARAIILKTQGLLDDRVRVVFEDQADEIASALEQAFAREPEVLERIIAVLGSHKTLPNAT